MIRAMSNWQFYLLMALLGLIVGAVVGSDIAVVLFNSINWKGNGW